MRRLVIATVLGLGLLSIGGLHGPAMASPIGAGLAAERGAAMPVHYQHHSHRHAPHRPYYAPPPRHWHRPLPPPRHYGGWHQPYQHHRGYR